MNIYSDFHPFHQLNLDPHPHPPDQEQHDEGVRDLALPDLHVHPSLHPPRCAQPHDLHVSANHHTVEKSLFSMEISSIFYI